MTCPVCGADNEARASFCFRCGTRLQPSVATTGQTVAFRPDDTPPFGLPAADRVLPAEKSAADAARVYDAPSSFAPPVQPATPRAFTVPTAPSQAGVSTPTSNNAIVSLVLALVGQLVFWVLACVSLGAFSVLGAAAGIPAVIVGRGARREIRASNGRIGGEGLATAGIVVGWITIGLSVLSLIIFVAVVGGLIFLAS